MAGGGVLTLANWLGGPDNVQVESTFPSSEKTYMYNFAQSVQGWNFELQAQTVVVDAIAYDRITGQPNFANSAVIGYFTPTTVTTSSYIQIMNTYTGIVNVTHPANLYTGPILPDARANIPLQVMSLTWSDASTPKQVNSHRIAKILAWEPGVTPGDPTQASVTTTITGWTPFNGSATTVYVADSVGIVVGSTFSINTTTYTVSSISTSRQISPTPGVHLTDLTAGLGVTFFNNNGYQSLI